MSNPNQGYANHRRLHPLFHFVLLLLMLVLLISSVTEFIRSMQLGEGILPAFIFVIVSAVLVVIFLLIRSYPLKAQDRAIRAEEGLRHYVLTNKLLDPRLTVGQIVALRFAADSEFPALCQRAAAEQLSPDAIKKSIQQWKDDNYRI